MVIFRLFSVLTLVLLNGCAGSPDKLNSQEESVEPVKISQTKREAQTSSAKTEIDPDVMYMLLAAELAGQRGQYEIALEGYMEAAKRVNDPRFAERAAKIAMYMKDSNKTNEAVSLWLSQDPNNITARKIAALSAVRAGDKQVAIEHVDKLLTIDPAGFENSMLELAVALEKENKVSFLYDVLDELSQRHQNQAEVYFVQSLLAMQMKNTDLAKTKIQQALNVQPDWDKAQIFQAQISASSGDLNTAAKLLEKAAAKYPENDKIKKLLAQVLIKAERYEEAGEVYQGIISANPSDAESQFALALVNLQLSRDNKAEDILKKLLEQPGWQSQASFYLGKIEEKRKNTKKALARFDEVRDGPFVLDAAISAISLLAKDNQFDEANSRLSSLQSQFPKQKLRLILIQAELYNQQKQYEQAFNLLTNALADMPGQKELLYTRALMAERLNRLDVLETDLKKILAEDPDNAEALNALGYTLAEKTNRYAEAEQYLEKALRLQPDEAVIMDSYGWLQFKLGNTDQALFYLQKAYAKRQEGEIAAHLAEVLWALNRKSEARKVFAKAIKDAPEDEDLLDFQQRVLNTAE
ncbi:tetratricopeptide repeat protein [Methylobacter sp. YRD-M1]|uniref:tetratricopeptide repeat protein n=1 Tax=Methylobacter sp. YRD-M1 TaxID=2911520 RepID=UPI00227D63FA|nr:tetratricopeptide repeat protein [Methylobacter sp. YRD-M1]WAK01770.1 tetratricopeptide repeat protein [Methylobacter sp. YRD-M1]